MRLERDGILKAPEAREGARFLRTVVTEVRMGWGGRGGKMLREEGASKGQRVRGRGH